MAHEVTTRFVPLRLHLFDSPRDVVRPLNVIWTPTILFADRRWAVHYRSINFLPPGHFLTVLDIGEAEVALRWNRPQQAIDRLRAAYERDPNGPLAAETLYRRGIATYLLTHSNPELYAIWNLLRERFPESEWSARVP